MSTYHALRGRSFKNGHEIQRSFKLSNFVDGSRFLQVPSLLSAKTLRKSFKNVPVDRKQTTEVGQRFETKTSFTKDTILRPKHNQTTVEFALQDS